MLNIFKHLFHFSEIKFINIIMIISNGKFKNINNKEIIKNNYSIETLKTKEKWLQSSKFCCVYNEILKDNVLSFNLDVNKKQENIDGIRNCSVKLSRIICMELEELIICTHKLQQLANNNGYIEKLISIRNIIGLNLNSMRNVYNVLSGFELEDNNKKDCDYQSFCFGLVDVINKIGVLLKNILKLNKMIDAKFVNKELQAVYNEMLYVWNVFLQLQVFCFK